MERKGLNTLQTIPENPRSPQGGAVGSPMSRPESEFGGSQTNNMGNEARFTLNGSAIRPGAGSTLSPRNGPDVSSALKDLKQNYQHLESAIVENTKR